MDLTLATMDQLNAVGDIAAAWDVNSFLDNAALWAKTTGGKVLAGLGVVGLVIGGVFAMTKLWSNNQKSNDRSWGKILALVIVGGALMTGGFSLMSKIGSGGQKTIEDLGGGTAIVQSVDPGFHFNGAPLGSLSDSP